MKYPHTEEQWRVAVNHAEAAQQIHSANRGRAETAYLSRGAIATARRILHRGRALGYYPDPIDVAGIVVRTLRAAFTEAKQ